jgi:hypothetical protein
LTHPALTNDSGFFFRHAAQELVALLESKSILDGLKQAS